MKLWRRPVADRIEPRITPPRPELRDASVGFSVGTFGSTASSNVSALYAENVSAVSACVSVISSTLASLPARVYRRVEGGRVEVSNHPVARLIRNPCEQMTWVELAEWLFSQVLLFGNGICVIEHDGAGRPIGLRPIPWPFVQVMLMESGRLSYNVTQFIAPWGGTGLARTYLADEILHLKARSNDGYLGVAPLARAPEVLEGALQIQAFTNASWRNGAVPSGVLTHPGKLNADGRQFLRSEFEVNYSGTGNAKKILVLDEGMSWLASAVKPVDAEVLASRLFSVVEICRLFNCPPQLAMAFENSAFTSAETAGKWFSTFTLTPWVRKLEAVFAKSLFADDGDCHLDLDMTGLVRGDYAARWASYATATQNKILTPDEIRAEEGWPPMPEAGELEPGAVDDP